MGREEGAKSAISQRDYNALRNIRGSKARRPTFSCLLNKYTSGQIEVTFRGWRAWRPAWIYGEYPSAEVNLPTDILRPHHISAFDECAMRSAHEVTIPDIADVADVAEASFGNGDTYEKIPMMVDGDIMVEEFRLGDDSGESEDLFGGIYLAERLGDTQGDFG